MLALSLVVLGASSGGLAYAEEETSVRAIPATRAKAIEDARQAIPGGGFVDPVRPPGTPRPDVPPAVRPHINEPVRDNASTTPRPLPGRPASTSPWELPRKNASSTRPFDDRVASNTQAMKERARKQAQGEMKRLAELMLATVDRFEKMIVRIESAATTLEGKGANVAKIREQVATAKTEISAVKADLATIQTAALAAWNASNMAAVVESISPARAVIQSARDHLQKARQAVMKATEELMRAARTVQGHASTTPTTAQ